MSTPVIFGVHDANTLAQLADVAIRAERVALMADGHLGYIMPVGGVAAYDGKVSVAGVGFDIACGNAAIRTGERGETQPVRGSGGAAGGGRVMEVAPTTGPTTGRCHRTHAPPASRTRNLLIKREMPRRRPPVFAGLGYRLPDTIGH
jgi:hypothetical protein